MSTSFLAPIRQALHGRHPILYLQTPEEDRVLRCLETLADEHLESAPVHTWTCTGGLSASADRDATTDPVTALREVASGQHEGFIVMLDLTAAMDQPAVIRALRDVYYALLERPRTVLVILSPLLVMPKALEKELYILELPLPEVGDLAAHLRAFCEREQSVAIAPELISELALTLRGLTLREVDHILHAISQSGDFSDQAIRDKTFDAKAMVVRKSGYLEYVPTHQEIAAIGGLDTLKDWIHKREKLFNQESVDAGLPMPKGILLMGISGCGKSLACKTVAAIWRIPLFRLDMNVVFSGLHGTPEATFHHALKTIESLAPAVVWIDEIENGLGVDVEHGNATGQIFSAFLTWMQEKPPMIFVAATANQIQQLPAEVLRKGRFDQVFFCDLPDEEEREEIMRVHVQRQGGDPDEIDVNYLAMATDGWNGAEIEQAVISARIDAHLDEKPLSTRHISRHTRSIVPLSETMSEQIKSLREWAWGRATSASKKQARL